MRRKNDYQNSKPKPKPIARFQLKQIERNKKCVVYKETKIFEKDFNKKLSAASFSNVCGDKNW